MKNLGQTVVALFTITLLGASCEEYEDFLIKKERPTGSTVSDSTVTDSIPTDTVVADTLIKDSVIVDSISTDSILIDTVMIDTVVIDSVIVDSIATDSVMYGTALLIWSGVYEADGCGFFLEIDEVRYKPEDETAINNRFRDDLSPQTEVTVEYQIPGTDVVKLCGNIPDSTSTPGVRILSLRKK